MKKDTVGMHLLKTGKRSFVRIVFSRSGLILSLLLIQFLFWFFALYVFRDITSYFWIISLTFSLVMFLVLLNSRIDPTAKLTWTVIIMLLPWFGSPLFFFTQSDIGHRTLKRRYTNQIQKSRLAVGQDEKVLQEISQKNKHLYMLNCYLNKSAPHPIWRNSSIEYFSSGEKTWQAMLHELKKAEKYIYLEYFIIEEGEMWGKILEILCQKAKEGVDVRIVYDGTCEFSTLPRSYPKKLKKQGIHCKVFSPITPFVSTHYNYRDHRKILVIDGKTAFTGGINLADEYINKKRRFGYWKDAAIMVKGDAVHSYATFFLDIWNMSDPQLDDSVIYEKSEHLQHSQGYVMPYVDCPLDSYKVGKDVYIDILNHAENYVFIMTPYLILDSELENAIRFAAERGAQVSIIVPSIPDKKTVFALAQTHYRFLLEAGVKLYEYTPGFMHSKVFLSDDSVAVVGTINLDYRSLYHHFETATYLYQTPCIHDIKQDFEETFPISREITLQNYKHQKRALRFLGAVLKIISPLL